MTVLCVSGQWLLFQLRTENTFMFLQRRPSSRQSLDAAFTPSPPPASVGCHGSRIRAQWAFGSDWTQTRVARQSAITRGRVRTTQWIPMRNEIRMDMVDIRPKRSVIKPNPKNCKNCSSKCDHDCAQLQYTIQHNSDNLPSYLQTTIIAQMLSSGGALLRKPFHCVLWQFNNCLGKWA